MSKIVRGVVFAVYEQNKNYGVDVKGEAETVSRPAEVLPLMLPWVEPGGWIVIPGSEEPPEPGGHPQIAQVEVRHYRAPSGGPLRSVWIGRRS